MKQVVISSITASRRWRSALFFAALVFFAGNAWASLSTGQVRQLPEGPGKAETQKLCSQCHELDKAFSLSQDRAGWQRTIEKMTGFGMKGTESELSAVLEYL